MFRLIALVVYCIMASKRSSCVFLYWILVLDFWLLNKNLRVQGIPSGNLSCSFPSFLQASCPKLSKTCRNWSQAIRIAHGRNMAFDGPVVNDRPSSGKRMWTFNGGKVEIIDSTTHNSQQNRITKFYCWKKVSPHIFIISSSNDSTKGDSNQRFSCIKFRKRGRNVIQYEKSAWKNNYKSLACNASDLITNEYPLIQTNLNEVVDCPSELHGGYRIMQFYNGETDAQCSYHNFTTRSAVLESDCLGGEGLVIHLPLNSDCLSKKTKAYSHAEENRLAFLCHSTAWKDQEYTYFIVKHKNLRTIPLSQNKQSDFLCARFRKLVKENGEEIELQIYNQPSCWRRNIINTSSVIFLIMKLKRRPNDNHPVRFPSEIKETRCSFPEKFQGTWNEISDHNSIQTVIINQTEVDIPLYGQFQCKTQYVFQHRAPDICNSLVTGKWPGMGRASFGVNDYLLVSNFSNGCRARVTRFGITDVISSHVLIYRLSQSVAFDYGAPNAEEYFNHYILRRFCSSWLPYIPDPYPLWGRNIEKILMNSPMRTERHQCPLPALGRGVYQFRSLLDNDIECHGTASHVYFACEDPFTIKIKYDSGCQFSDVSFTCLGTAQKIGQFFFARNERKQSINCLWFDKENKQLFRLNSPQCSDIDWGKHPLEERNFAEKFVFRYYSKCPVLSRKKDSEYPIVIRSIRSESSDFYSSRIVTIVTLALVVKIL